MNKQDQFIPYTRMSEDQNACCTMDWACNWPFSKTHAQANDSSDDYGQQLRAAPAQTN